MVYTTLYFENINISQEWCKGFLKLFEANINTKSTFLEFDMHMPFKLDFEIIFPPFFIEDPYLLLTVVHN